MSKTQSRAQNDNRAIDVIEECRKGAKTLSQLAQACHVTRPTIVPVLNELITAGLVREEDSIVDGGRPSRVFALSPTAGIALGIDLLHKTMGINAIDLSGKIIYSQVIRLKANNRAERYHETREVLKR